MLTFGLEEEVFLIETEKPSLQSLYYLARLLKTNPRFYYTHSASNFTQGRDVKVSLMAGVEIATEIKNSPAEAVQDLKKRRQDLIDACGDDCLIIPLGSLLHLSAPTLTCALQVHLGGFDDVSRAYQNLAYFLPLLILAAANSPAKNGKHFGPSYRLAHSFAIGPLKEGDQLSRFQDLIVSRRLKTIEIRVFDPIWDLDRLQKIIEAVEAIAKIKDFLPFDYERYNQLRNKVIQYGYCKEIEFLYRELCVYFPCSKEIFLKPPAEEVWFTYQKMGLENTYQALDNAYRTGNFAPTSRQPPPPRLWKKAVGIGFYYLPKLPYIAWKFLREHGYI